MATLNMQVPCSPPDIKVLGLGAYVPIIEKILLEFNNYWIII